MNLQPYQQASEKIRKQAELPYEIAKGAAGLAGTGKIAGKILPLLNQFIPDDLRQKALSKIDPRLGSFYKQAADSGFDAGQITDFLKNKFSEGREQTKESEAKKPPTNPIQDFETNYPELARGLMATIQNGQTPQAAAGILKTSTSLGKMVKKLEKETGKNFVDYVLELFGPQGGGMQQQGQPQQQMQPQQQPQGSAEANAFANPALHTQQPQGDLDPELMQIMQNIQKTMGNIRK